MPLTMPACEITAEIEMTFQWQRARKPAPCQWCSVLTGKKRLAIMGGVAGCRRTAFAVLCETCGKQVLVASNQDHA